MSTLTRIARWTIPIVIIVEAVLFFSGRASLGDALLIVVPIELLFIGAVIVEIREVIRIYHREIGTAPDRFTAVMHGLESALPKPMGKLLKHELTLQRAVLLFVMRRRDVPDGAERIAYHKPLVPLISAVFIVSLIELLAVHLAVPWPSARLWLTVFSVIGVWWFVAFFVSLLVYPSSVSPDAVRIRFSSMIDISVPRSAIDRAAPVSRSRGQRRIAMFSDDALIVEVASSTNTAIYLKEPVSITLDKNGERRVTEIHVWADNPRDLMQVLTPKV